MLAARAEGVRTGLREREAQSRCPTLVVHAHQPEVDERRFAPVAAALDGQPRLAALLAARRLHAFGQPRLQLAQGFAIGHVCSSRIS